MIKTKKFKKTVVLLLLGGVIVNASAAHIVPDYDMKQYDQVINHIYEDSLLKANRKDNKNNYGQTTIADRIAIISAYFLGDPYLGGALGEGKSAPFDQEPLYRTDAFDCLTYVSTVLALAESNNLADFQENLLKIQYRNANPIFIDRLHFTSIDWNQENAKNGFIRDITGNFKDASGKSVAKIANALINKPNWYKKMTDNNLSLIEALSEEQEKERVAELQHLSRNVSVEKSVLLYLPLTALFDKQGQAAMFLFNQIPSSAIIEIVRPNWDLENAIGTHINVSHLGFAIRKSNGDLVFREASSVDKHVEDVLLIDYLKNYLNNATVKGINVQEVSSRQVKM